MTTQPEPETEIAFVKWLSQLRTDVAESVGGTLLRGARVVQVGATEGATRRPCTSPGALVGYGLISTDAAPAFVNLRDGEDATGALVVPVEIPAGAGVTAWFGPGGLNLSRGLFVEIVAGGVEGSVYLRGTD